MSVIEEAARRLEQLQRAGVKTRELPKPLPAEAEGSHFDASTPQATRPHAQARVTPASPDRATAPKTGPTDLVAEPCGVSSRRVDLDLTRLAENGIVTPDAPRSRIADEFRVIKRPLLVNAALDGASAIANGNLIIITSAVPGEGKSFTAVNLAMSMAMELDRTVLLVDADVARPSLPTLIGLPETRGLLDLLVDPSAQLADVLLRTNIEKLSILPSGTPHPRATELLASDAMNQLLSEIAQRYADRIILFDAPPLLVTTEARVLAAYMGQVVLVVEADSTPQAVVKHALSTIESCPVKLLLLNKARASSRESYGYGYGYGYGH